MNRLIQKGTFFLIAILAALQTFAQEKEKTLDVDINVNKGDSQWYQQPWVWIVGVAVFILLLAAILRGGSRKEA
ncbi:MAG TPA: hypothetical protein VGO58_14545 [Chitinophagaceae bacterium]|jgi:hypothetical protein|nr:hypothetical protein [Chitinophagaceae bacterium]